MKETHVFINLFPVVLVMMIKFVAKITNYVFFFVCFLWSVAGVHQKFEYKLWEEVTLQHSYVYTLSR